MFIEMDIIQLNFGAKQSFSLGKVCICNMVFLSYDDVTEGGWFKAAFFLLIEFPHAVWSTDLPSRD